MIKLRQHQIDGTHQIDQHHAAGFKNVVLVCPTGGGKTILMASIAHRAHNNGQGCIIFAHRDVLLEQISAALCQFNIYHSIWASKPTITDISNLNLAKFGNSYYRDTSKIILASVDTFYRRDISGIIPHINLWMMDEGHHMTKGSKWHKCIERLDETSHCKGILFTATPIRADRKGLGRHASGVADSLIVLIDMAELIRRGLLSPYKIFVPENLVQTDGVNVTSGGDFNRDKLAEATDKSHITGSVIEHWKQIAYGKQTIIFTVNIAHSDHVAEKFRAEGINAVALSSEDTRANRARCIADFRAGKITVLVNCDLFGEGFDVPAVEVVVSLRKTLSYSLFKQQFGRMLRTIDGKPYGIFIDHVGNVPYFMQKFALANPHDDPEWTLDDGERKAGGSGGGKQFETITCKKCRAFYVVTSDNREVCPECGHRHSEDELLDETKKFQERRGKLVELELNLELFNRLIEERAKVDESPEVIKRRMRFAGAPAVAYNSAYNNQLKRANAQVVLRSLIQTWCQNCHSKTGYPPPLVQREFELAFGIPILKAHTLSEPETLKLAERIKNVNISS